VPAHVLHAGDDADGLPALFQDGALFDMHFKRRLDGLARHWLIRGNAQPFEFQPHAVARAIREGIRRIQRQTPRPYGRAHHGHRKAATLLVAPDPHFDRMRRGHAGIVQRFDDLESGQHAINAVEFAARGLRIQMAAGQDHRERVLEPGAAHEQVAHGIHTHLATRGLRPVGEQPAPRQVLIG
jgi:hypothetical protein